MDTYLVKEALHVAVVKPLRGGEDVAEARVGGLEHQHQVRELAVVVMVVVEAVEMV